MNFDFSEYTYIRSFTITGLMSGALILSGCDSSQLLTPAGGTTAQSNIVQQHYDRSVANYKSVALVNGDFEAPLGNLPGWSACVDNNKLATSTFRGNNFVEVSLQECILQAVGVEPGSENTLSCDLTAYSSDQWSGMAISFYDSNGNFLSESNAAEVGYSTSFQRKTVVGTAPPDTDTAVVWFYTEPGGQIDNCQLQSLKQDNQQQYRKTVTVEKNPPGSYTPFGGTDGFVFNGITSLQIYNQYRAAQSLVDGFDREGRDRDPIIALALNDDYLHVVVTINKGRPEWSTIPDPAQVVADSFPVNGELWQDDSFEIYINAGNEATAGYDDNDFVRIYGYADVARYEPTTVTGFNSTLNLTNEAKCYIEEFNAVSCEVRFSLEELGIAGQDVSEIGFDVHVNVDDDGGEREAKYSWCGGGTTEAWQDMSVLDCSLEIIQ